MLCIKCIKDFDKKTCKEGTRERFKCKGVDIVMMGLAEVGCGCMERIHLTEDGVQ